MFDNHDELIQLYGVELVEEEERLEDESSLLGYERFIHNINNGEIAGTKKSILTESIPVYSKAIQSWLDDVDTGKPGKRHSAAKVFKLLDCNQSAYIVLKTILTSVATSKGFIMLSILAADIGDTLESHARFETFFQKLTKKEKAVVEAGLSKRVGESYRRAYLRAYEKHVIERGELDKWRPYSREEKVNVGLKSIELFIQSTGMGKIFTEKQPKDEHYTYYFEFDNDVLKYIDYTDKELANLMFIPRPMVIPPKPWTSPFDGGYYKQLARPISLIRASAKKVKKHYEDVEMPDVYEAVNRVQATPWRVSPRILKIAKAVADMPQAPAALGFPSKDPEEKPYRDPVCDTNPEAQKAWRLECVRYYQRDNERKGRRLSYMYVLNYADTFSKYERIYFPNNLDFRSRVYPLTTLSPQGSDFQKGLLEFAEGKPLGEDGATWLAFHGANCYGLDKKPLEERLSWVYSNAELISNIAKDPLEHTEWMEADSPWCFLAFCFEWAEYLEKGSEYESHIAIAFDGSCSGIQHFSAMLRDEVGAVAVNLIPDDKVHDIYGIVANKVKEMIKADMDSDDVDTVQTDKEGNEYIKKGKRTLATEWNAFGIDRYVTKRSVMTLPYGSKEYGFKDQILEDTIYPAVNKNPNAFSAPGQAATYMAKLIWTAVHEVVVKAMEAMSWLQQASALLAKDRDIEGKPMPTYWVTPVGFPVWQEYFKVDSVKVRSILSGPITIYNYNNVPIREAEKGEGLVSTCSRLTDVINPRKQRQGIAPNFVHSMDASHLMLTVLACGREHGITSFALIHDSFGTHAGNAGVLFNTVRECFVRMYQEHDVLNDLHDHIKSMLSAKYRDELPEAPSKGNLDLNLVKQSIYAFA